MPNPRFLISDESVNHHGYRILMAGGDISFFLKNPVLLYNHFRSDETCTVYGRWEDVELGEGSITGVPIFDLKDKEGKRLDRKVREGFLKACSIHIRPLEASDDPALKLPGQTGPTVTKWQLKEGSIVDIPGNGMAVVLCDEDGKEIDPYKLSDFISKPKSLPAAKSSSSMDELKFISASLGLKDGATLTDVNTEIMKLKDVSRENETLKLQLKDIRDKEASAREVEAVALLDAAEQSGKITSASRAVYASALKADHANGKALLDALTPTVKLKDVTPGAGGGKTDSTGLVDGKYNGKTFDELSKLNDGADLIKLKEESFETFAALYKEQYDREYVQYKK